MIREKGIVEVHDGHADTDELLDSVDSLPDGEYGYLLFDKKKNRSLPQLKFLFGYLLKTLSEELEGHPEPEALYRYFEEIYAPIHRCKIPGEEEEFEYFDLKMNQQLRWISSLRRLSITLCQNGILTCFQETALKRLKHKRLTQELMQRHGRIFHEKFNRIFLHDGTRKHDVSIRHLRSLTGNI